MPANNRNNPIFPYPEDKEARRKALDLHKQAKRKEKPIPHFIRNDDPTDIHYWEGKGHKEIRLINKNLKNARTAKRDASKRGQTPTQKTYTDAWGEETGKRLYLDENNKTKGVYQSNNVLTNDVDHIDSLADGGIHGSRNLRSHDSSINRREGRRRLTPELKRQLMVEGNIETYVRTQGPLLTTSQREKLLNGNGNGKKPRIPKLPLIGGAIAAASNVLPSQATTQKARDYFKEGEGSASGVAISYGTDLAVGGSTAATFNAITTKAIPKAVQFFQAKIGKKVSQKFLQHCLMKGAKKLAVKGAASLVGGPYAPAIMTGLLITECYGLVDTASGGALSETFTPKQINTANRKRHRNGSQQHKTH